MTAPVSEKIKPSAAWYVIGVLLLLVSVIAPTVLTIVGVAEAFGKVTDLQRVPVDGGEVTLEAGDFTIYGEGPNADQFTSLSGADLEVIQPNGDPEDLSFSGVDTTYDWDGNQGQALATFTADEAGAYQVGLVDGADPDNINELAVGPSISEFFADSLIYFILAGVIGLVAFVIGLILLIRTGVKRGKAKRQRRLSPRTFNTGYGGQPAPPGYPPPPGAGTPPPGF
jgi:hypothetical protein